LRILNLKSENVKGIKVIDITPKDNMVIISGKNGAGKTSAIDSLWYALLWKAGSKGVPMPIRKGEKSADIQVTLCEDLTDEEIAQGKTPKSLFIVNRNWTANNKTYLKVTNGEGLQYLSPQKLLDDFVGFLSVDPRKFTTMSGKEHRDILIKITGFDVTGIEEKITELRERRRLQGQKVKLLSGEREEITIKDLPGLPINTSELSDKYDKAVKLNNQIEKFLYKGRDNLRRINECKSKISELEEMVNILEDENKEFEKWFLKNKSVDVSGIKEEINNAYTINEQIKTWKRNEEADKKQKEAQMVYDGFTKEIERLTAEIEDGLRKSWSKIPDQKLSLTEVDIAYDGVPYSQISFSEQLRVAMKIAMITSKKLNVVSISDYSLLDDKNKEIIRQMAKEFNCQVWAEEVDDSGTKGFYIEEGELKNG